MKQNSLRALFLCMLMLVLVVSLPSTAAGGAETVILEAKPIIHFTYISISDEGFEYSRWSDGTCSVSRYDGQNQEVTVPGTLGGYPVRRIGSDAFSELPLLTRVILPEGIKVIEENAFINCPSLTTISLPDSLTFIDDNAFVNTGPLTPLVREGSYAHKYVMNHKFFQRYIRTPHNDSPIYLSDTENLAAFREGPYAYLLLEDGTAEIASYLGNETILTLPDTLGGLPVTRIREYAFMNLTDLKAVAIPEGVKSIGDLAFHADSSLRLVTFPHSLLSIGEEAFDYTGLMKLILPEGVQEISHAAFWGCGGLTEAILPDSLTYIGDYVFYGCSNLNTIIIPANVQTISWSAFENCSGLHSVHLSEGLLTIAGRAFSGCHALTVLAVPKSVTSINDEAFYDIPNLKLVVTAGSYAEQYALSNGIPHDLTSP